MRHLALTLALLVSGCSATSAKMGWPYPIATTEPGDGSGRGGGLPDGRDGIVEIDGTLREPGAEPTLHWPVPPRAVNSGFGDRTNPLDGHRRFHGGVDLEAPYGTLVGAAAWGRVIHAGWSAGHGRQVIVDHGHGLHTVYSHLSQLLVSEGTRVRAGDVIGTVGNSGRSTGPHLHFEVSRDGEAIDPLMLLPDPGSHTADVRGP